MNDIILLLLTALSSLFFSYLIVTFFNMGGDSDSSLDRDLQQVVLQIVSNVFNTIFIPLIGIWNIITDVSLSVFGNFKWTIAFGFFTVCTLMMHYYHYEILSILDDSWKCFLIPLMNNIIEPFLQITRVFYALFIPLVNGFTVMHAQLFKAWYITFTACSHINMFKIFTELGMALVEMTVSFGKWFGWDGAYSETNNMFYNDFNIAIPVNHTMQAVYVGKQVLTCACTRFSEVFDVFFFVTQEPHIVAAIDNFYQVGIRVFQLFFQTLFNEFPNIYRVLFKLERFIIESGLALDSIFFNTIGNVIGLFDDEFELNRYPEEFVFTIIGQLLSSVLHFSATLFVNGPLHLMASYDPKLTAINPKVWSLEHSFALLHKSTYTISVIGQWFVYVVEQIVTGKQDLSAVFSNKDTPLKLSCNWARDVDKQSYVNLPYTTGCVMYNFGILSVNAGAIIYGSVVELLLKSVFTTGGQDVFRTLQRWEGPTIARKKVFTCEEREAATAFDYTTNHYNSTGWIWTQDRAVCQCDEHYGTTLDEHVPQYNPWCGQPSLNQDIFAPLDALVMHVSHGILGPGFGDAFPFITPIREIGIDISEVDMDTTFALPIALPPITRTAIETMRILTRVVLSFGDILTGHFFNYPVNCGHGLNHLQLIARWNSTFGTNVDGTSRILPNTEAELRWDPCELNSYKSTNTDKERTPVCSTNNNVDTCMCSYMSPLTPTSACQCIARYPDIDITASSQQVGDLIEQRFTSQDVAIHWCNSMIIEWTFQNTAAFADALDYIVSLGPINPTCDVSDRIFKNDNLKTDVADTRKEKSSGYLIATTPTLSLSGNFKGADEKMNHLEDLYSNRDTGCGIQVDADGLKKWVCGVATDESVTSMDAESALKDVGCTIWGRNDFFCSAGLYIRNSRRYSLNIARQIVNDGISIIAGNFEDVNLKTLPRLCDYERQQGALASMVAGIIPNIGDVKRKILARYVNIVLQISNVRTPRMLLTVVNVAVQLIKDFVTKSEVTTSKVEEEFKNAVNILVEGYVYDIIEFFKVTGDLLNSIVLDSGKICLEIADIMSTVRDNLSEGLVDLVAEFVKLFLQMFAALVDPSDSQALDGFVETFFSVVSQVLVLLSQQVWLILDKIYDFFGPVGTFFKVLTNTVCEAINTVMGILEGFSFNAFTWEPMTCVAPSLSHGHNVNHTAGRLGRHFLRAEDDNQLPKRIAETLDWSGISVCDHFMSAAADYTYTELRPLERAKWFECLEYKLIGVEIGKFLNSKTFPTDIVYNWKRKYIMLYDFVRVIRIILPSFFDKKMDWVQIRLQLYEAGVDADLYMNMFQSSTMLFHTLVAELQPTKFVSFVLEKFDSEYDNKDNPSSTAKTWRSFSKLQSSYQYAHEEWVQKDMAQNMWKAIDAGYESQNHLVMWWNTIGHETEATQTHTERVLHNLKRNWNKGTSITKSPHHHSRPSWLGVPIKVGIQRCAERGSPGWCTECAVLDNILETTMIQGNAMASFYGDYFPDILKETQLYFTNKVGDDFFQKRYTKLGNNHEQPMTTSTTDTRWLYYVKNDWVYLATNFTTYLLNTSLNSSHKEKWLQHVDKFLNSSRKFFTYTDDTYVPFFGYSLFHIYDYLLFSSCDLHESIFVSTTIENRETVQEARLNRLDNALLTCLLIAIVIATNTSWSIIPLVWLANTVVISAIVIFVYLYMVYGYMLSCAPLVPYTLVEDVYAWYDTRLQPGCFYKLLPYMAMTGNMTDDLCQTCSAPDAWTQDKMDSNARNVILNASTWNATTQTSAFNGTFYDITLGQHQQYINCAEYESSSGEQLLEDVLSLKELIGEYGIFWTSLFWVRWTFPEIGVFAIKNGLVAFDSALGKLALEAWQETPIDNVWIDCYYAMWLNNVLTVVVLVVGIYILFKMVIVGFQTLIQLTMLVVYIYTSISWMSLSVENSIVIDE